MNPKLAQNWQPEEIPDVDAPTLAPLRALIEFLKPSEVRDYQPPPGTILVGDCHITRGSVFVIGGAPGVGKSRAAVSLAVAGAFRKPWFGLPVHTCFRTMVIQSENGRLRLSREFAGLDCADLDDHFRICPQPPYGLCFDRKDFRDALSRAVVEFRPDLVIVDPWNAAARDEKARDYLETFELIRSILPAGDDSPALGIVAHTRKPKTEERTNGRALLHLLAGSYVLGSVPRSAFILQHASDDPQEIRVIFTCCKNNDGELGSPSAWHRHNGLFVPDEDFDWSTFYAERTLPRGKISEDDIAAIFDRGATKRKRSEAKSILCKRCECGDSAAYDALKLDGRFASHLDEDENGMLCWRE